MLTIDKAITEAQAEEMAEKEVNEATTRAYKNAPVSNMVTISLDEYLSLYMSMEKYCRLLSLISGIVEPSDYFGVRLNNANEILDFVKYNELDLYVEILKHAEAHRGAKEGGEGL